jgi:hypothetical protein
MKLTLKEGKGFIPVAKIDGEGRLDSEILYIDPSIRDDAESDDDGAFDMDNRDIDYARYIGSKLKPRDAVMKQNQLAKHLYAKTKPIDDELLGMYNRIHKDSAKELRLKTGTFQPVPNINNERNIFYIFGPSGSGKSYFTASVLRQFLKLHPNKEVYIFSKLDDDKVIDKLGNRVKRINIDTLAENPMDVTEFPKGSMVVFDDVDMIEDKIISNAIFKLENSLYQVGRHYDLSVVKTSHLGSDYKRTRVILTEAHYIVCYPRSGSFQQIQYVLKQYMGMDNKQIDRIKNVKSRWCLLHKNYPQYVLTETECFLL